MVPSGPSCKARGTGERSRIPNKSRAMFPVTGRFEESRGVSAALISGAMSTRQKKKLVVFMGMYSLPSAQNRLPGRATP